MIDKKTKIYLLLTITLLTITLPLASCSSPRQSLDTEPASASKESISSGNEVIIEGNTFKPDDITIKAGETITWINKDSYNHTITENNGLFDSGNIANGEEFSFTFENEGNFDYICGIHTFMKGSVTVTK